MDCLYGIYRPDDFKRNMDTLLRVDVLSVVALLGFVARQKNSMVLGGFEPHLCKFDGVG